MPVRDRSATVIEALEAVAAQSVLPENVIVVDDGSKDGTSNAILQWIEAVQPQFTLKLLNANFENAYKARNLGMLHLANEEYVLFLDSDDIVPPDFFEKALGALADYMAEVAVADQLIEEGTNKTFRNLLPASVNPAMWLLENDSGIMSNTLIRKSSLKAQPFQEGEKTGSDLEFFLALAVSSRWRHIPSTVVRIRLGVAKQRGEAHNISRKLPGRHVIWAKKYELNAKSYGSRAGISDRHLAIYITRRWKIAFHEAIVERRWDDCITAGMRWVVWNFRCLFPLNSNRKFVGSSALVP